MNSGGKNIVNDYQIIRTMFLGEELFEPDKQIFFEVRAGNLCPICGGAYLEYDGLLNLSCPSCKFTQVSCFT